MAGTFSDMLTDIKTTYTKKVVEVLVNAEQPFTRELPKEIPAGSRIQDGGVLKFNAVTGLPENVGAHADGGSMPVPHDRSSVQFTLTPVVVSGTTTIGEGLKAAAATDKSAFNGGELNRRVEETVVNLAKYMEQMYCATHGTGRIGVVLSDGTKNVVLDRTNGMPGGNLMRKNMRVSIRTTDGGDSIRDSIDYAVISKIVRGNGATGHVMYYTFDGGDSEQTAVAGDSIHIVTQAAQTSLSTINLNGMRGLVDDGTLTSTLHALTRATYPEINSNVVDSGSVTPLTEQMMMACAEKIRQESGKTPGVIWTGIGQARMYARFVRPDRRTSTSGVLPDRLEAGYKDDIYFVAPGCVCKIMLAPDIVPREMFFLDLSAWIHYQAKPMGWLDEGASGKPPLWLTPGTNTYKASWFSAMVAVENIGLSNPKSQCVLRSLTDPMGGDTVTDL